MLNRVGKWDENQGAISQEALQLNNKTRKLWKQHIMWTRTFIVSAVEPLGDLDEVANRLLRNPSDFARLLARYYDIEKVDPFRILFEDHLKIAAEIIMSIKMQDADAARGRIELWYANADAMAASLAQMGESWTEEEWKKHFHHHLEMVTEYMNLRFNRDYKADPFLYDEMEAQALEMADFMFEGTMRQFNL